MRFLDPEPATANQIHPQAVKNRTDGGSQKLPRIPVLSRRFLFIPFSKHPNTLPAAKTRLRSTPRRMKPSTLVTLVGAALLPVTVAGRESAGNYQHSCTDIKMVDINRPDLQTLRLRARCNQNTGGQFLNQQLSCLDLNKCYANQHSLIYPKPE
jgi:hypothetical protein